MVTPSSGGFTTPTMNTPFRPTKLATSPGHDSVAENQLIFLRLTPGQLQRSCQGEVQCHKITCKSQAHCSCYTHFTYSSSKVQQLFKTMHTSSMGQLFLLPPCTARDSHSFLPHSLSGTVVFTPANSLGQLSLLPFTVWDSCSYSHALSGTVVLTPMHCLGQLFLPLLTLWDSGSYSHSLSGTVVLTPIHCLGQLFLPPFTVSVSKTVVLTPIHCLSV